MRVFRMPSLGSDMEAGTLVEWLVAPGDQVRRGDVVAVVETQKGAIEIEIFEEGEIARLLAKPGDKAPVGAPLAELHGAGAEGEAPEPEAAPSARTPPRAADAAAPPRGAPDLPGAEGGAPPSSPAARLLARERGVELAGIAGTGPGGAILLRDVETAGERPGGPESARGFDPAAMRAAVGAAMARSKREIPHYYLSHEIDLQATTEWLAETNAARPPDARYVMTLLFLRATALAARRHARFNGFWTDDAFQPAEGVHPGLVVSLRGGGLVAPALRDADALGLDELMQAMRELVARARAGRLRSSEMSDATITVSSLGERGADALFGVIFPPQTALIGFGTPRLRPIATEGGVEARSVVTATLAADHRASDGRAGARFLREIATLLQSPETL